MAPVCLILRPTGTGQITAHDAFHRQGPAFAHQHGAAGEHLVIRLQGGGEVRHRKGDHVVGHDVGQVPEPEGGEGGEDAALVRDGFVHDHVKGGHAVRGHQQEVVAQVVDVPHLALVAGKPGEIGGQHRGAHRLALRAGSISRGFGRFSRFSRLSRFGLGSHFDNPGGDFFLGFEAPGQVLGGLDPGNGS